jgi:hypothetical protein
MSANSVIALAAAALMSVATAVAQQQTGPLVEVFKTPTCGCCSQWVTHMRANGFTIRTTDLKDLAEIKKSRGVPDQLQSCHTAVVNGYVVEGHIPAADVHRLLKEKPAVAGIAVAGMPVGSPGMEYPGTKAQPYNVMSFTKTGATSVFAKH